MRRPRRHCWLTLTMFLVCCVGQAVLSSLPEDQMKEATSSEIFSTEESRHKDESSTQTIPGNRHFEREDEETMTKKGIEEPENSAGKWRRRLRNCSPAAIEQFPRPLLGQGARKHGGLVIHILVAVFTFIGLSTVCNGYFVPSVKRISKELRLSPDVAGATFMAGGCCMPQLLTVIIGVQEDRGVSGVIGSAVFNIMFVISVCALCAGTVSHLNWWPLCRDCFFYAVSIFAMFYSILNGVVSWQKALLMLIIYSVYCVVLAFDSAWERYRNQKKRMSTTGASAAATSGDVQALSEGQSKESDTEDTENNKTEAKEPDTTLQPVATPPADHNEKSVVNPLAKPNGATSVQLACWYVTLPVHLACRCTMPDYRGRWYPVSFLISILWMSFYSYFMVWMITIIGHTLGIPNNVMGLTFMAAGACVPEALSSLAAIKEGYVDMAMSNVVGSNVFNILVYLGLPWFIKTAIIQPGSSIEVYSPVLYSTFSLVSTVMSLMVATHLNGWKLDRKYGVVIMICYLLYITLASLFELNFFGDFRPPECLSMY